MMPAATRTPWSESLLDLFELRRRVRGVRTRTRPRALPVRLLLTDLSADLSMWVDDVLPRSLAAGMDERHLVAELHSRWPDTGHRRLLHVHAHGPPTIGAPATKLTAAEAARSACSALQHAHRRVQARAQARGPVDSQRRLLAEIAAGLHGYRLEFARHLAAAKTTLRPNLPITAHLNSVRLDERRNAISGISRTTTDHDVIKRWAEAREGVPARVKGTERHGAGLLRILFPDASDPDALDQISWTDFFQKFEEKSLALAYQEATSEGAISRFNKIVSRSHS